MASTYSSTLRLELIGNGDQSGTWGDTTNINLGTLIESAITGVQAITMSDANYTLTAYNGLPDEARNAVLVVSGTNTASRQIIAPAVEKTYIVKNSTTGGFSVVIKTSGGTGVTVENGQTALVYCDGTDFYSAAAAAGQGTTGSGSVVYSNSPTLTGTPLAPTASAGTNTTQIATTAFVGTAITNQGLGTIATQNANSVAITGGSITGITDLAVADGGTGSSSLSANAVLLGNGTSALQTVAPGTSGNVLTSNGTTWASSTPAAPTVLTNSTYGIGTTYSVSVTGTRPVILSMNYAGVQGGDTTVVVTFEWGFGSLTNSWTPVNSGVNYVVYPCPSVTVMLTPSGTSTLYFRVSTANLGNQQFFVSAIQL